MCGEQLHDKYLTFDDKPVCEADLQVNYPLYIILIITFYIYQALVPACRECNTILAGSVFMLGNEYYCQQHYQVASLQYFLSMILPGYLRIVMINCYITR